VGKLRQKRGISQRVIERFTNLTVPLSNHVNVPQNCPIEGQGDWDMCVHIYVHAHMCVYMYMCIYVYVYIHMNTYFPLHQFLPLLEL
jgi:hypothetical protein